MLMDDLPKPPIMLYSEKPARQAERTKKEPSFNSFLTLCPSVFGTNRILGKNVPNLQMYKKVTNLHALSRSLFLTSTLKIGFIGEKQKKPQPKEWDISSQDISQGSTDYKSFACSHSLVYSQEVIV